VSRSDADLLEDIENAIGAIRSHLTHGPLTEPLVMDAVSMRLLEIGESVKALSDTAKASESGIKWRQIAGMRDVLAHHYFATHPEIIQATVDKDLGELAGAVSRMRGRQQQLSDGGT
jgi:uncharacterized protein with HEPN domain